MAVGNVKHLVTVRRVKSSELPDGFGLRSGMSFNYVAECDCGWTDRDKDRYYQIRSRDECAAFIQSHLIAVIKKRLGIKFDVEYKSD